MTEKTTSKKNVNNPSTNAKQEKNIRIIKKYPNRRLYDTTISSYITLDDVRQIVIECEEFKIIDSKTKEDITRSVLMQIINDQEDKGEKPMFTNDFLQQVIRSYGNSMQDMLSGYFDKTIALFMNHQKNMQDGVSSLMDAANPLNEKNTVNPVNYFQSLAQKNLDIWQKSWQNLKTSKKDKE